MSNEHEPVCMTCGEPLFCRGDTKMALDNLALSATCHMIRESLSEMTADRDEWRTQHENLLAMYRASEARVHDMMHERDVLRVELKFAREQTDAIAPLATQADILRTKCANQRRELKAINSAMNKGYDLYEKRIADQLETIIRLKNLSRGGDA